MCAHGEHLCEAPIVHRSSLKVLDDNGIGRRRVSNHLARYERKLDAQTLTV